MGMAVIKKINALELRALAHMIVEEAIKIKKATNIVLVKNEYIEADKIIKHIENIKTYAYIMSLLLPAEAGKSNEYNKTNIR